jgi:NADPH2:quinone reductase
MRALVLASETGPSGLELREDVPEPAPNEITLAVTAAGVGHVDLVLARGEYQARPELPFVPGFEVCGTVASAKPETGFQAGERVAAYTELGGWAELAAAPAAQARRLASGEDERVAAGSVVNVATAVFALVVRGRLARGESVIVLGAGGGLGSAAVAVAVSRGAEVIAVVSSPAKADVAAAAGAQEIVPGDDWQDARRTRLRRRVDLVFDPVGGEATVGALTCLRPGGRLVLVGFTDSVAQIPANRVLLGNAEVIGANWEPERWPYSEMAELAAEGLGGATQPGLVLNHFPLADGRRALEALAERSLAGKAVLDLRD